MLRFRKTHLDAIAQLTGQPFTWDASCPDNGPHSLCTSFSSTKDDFLAADLQNQHVWIAPPAHQADAYISHFMASWKQAPHTTSACILLPKPLSHAITPYAANARIIHRLSKGDRVWEGRHPDGTFRPHLRSPWSYLVFHIPPLSGDSPAPGDIHVDTALGDPEPTPLAFLLTANAFVRSGTEELQ